VYTTSKENKVVSMRFSKELTEKLEAEARMRGMSVSKLCNKIVSERLGDRVATSDYIEGFRQGRAWQETVREELVKPSTVFKQEPVKPPPEGERRITRFFLGRETRESTPACIRNSP
jgi:hypothetical protein